MSSSGRYISNLIGFGLGVGLSFAVMEYVMGTRKVVIKHNNTVNCSNYEEAWKQCSTNYAPDAETCKELYSKYLQCINLKKKVDTH